ncbi:MAG: RsmD family RNA methyltransferase [Acidobacteria bacterium]|nr:RsmD family RNA methyltransferase [Acidobacteriota bacterium]
MIRITSGELRSRRVEVPRGIRPTTEMVRKALFDILGPRVEGSMFVDVAAGSGAVGIEALSRGAKHAVFVEKDRRTAAVLARSLVALGLEARSTVSLMEVSGFARLPSVLFDIAFFDPPYGDPAASAVPALLEKVGPGGVLVFETGPGEVVETPPGFETSVRRYGETRLIFFERPRSLTAGAPAS